VAGLLARESESSNLLFHSAVGRKEHGKPIFQFLEHSRMSKVARKNFSLGFLSRPGRIRPEPLSRNCGLVNKKPQLLLEQFGREKPGMKQDLGDSREGSPHRLGKARHLIRGSQKGSLGLEQSRCDFFAVVRR
jgi:hypothetical protein